MRWRGLLPAISLNMYSKNWSVLVKNNEKTIDLVVYGFKPEDLPFDEDITKKFIGYLLLIGVDEREIRSFFDEYCDTYCGNNYCIGSWTCNYKGIEKYHRMLFWGSYLRFGLYRCEETDTPIYKLYEYVRTIVEYILEKERYLLVKDIGEYIEENKQNRYAICYVRPNYSEMGKNPYDKYYPVELFEAIKPLIPNEFLDYFEYERYTSKETDLHINKREKQERDTECDSDEALTKKDFHDIWKFMINSNSKYSLSKCVELFKTWHDESDFIDDHWKFIAMINECKIIGCKGKMCIIDRKKFVAHIIKKKEIWGFLARSDKELLPSKCVKLISKWIKEYIDEYIRGSKCVTDREEFEAYTMINGSVREYVYAKIITKWGKYLPIELLKKEIDKKNEECIAGALYSQNEYVVRALLAYIYKGNDVIIRDNYHYMSDRNNYKVYFEDKESYAIGDLVNIGYYKLLIGLFTSSCWIKRYFKYLHCLTPKRISNIFDIVNSNAIIGEKIINTLKEANIDLFHKLTFEEYSKLNELEKKRNECSEKKTTTEIDSDISIKNEIEQEIDKILNKDRAPNALQQIYDDGIQRAQIAISFWLHEHKEFNLQNIEFSNKEYRLCRDAILEKPFFFPLNSNENRIVMANYLSRERPFIDFCNETQNLYLSENVLWKRYWQEIIEKTYDGFTQPKFDEKPLLPIISEYADYLLSRTNGIFSTAIKNTIYSEFEIYLAESRKLQINKLLKKKVLKQEEVNKLIKMAESQVGSQHAYYAWSDKEVKGCLLSDANLEILQNLHANLEPIFMVRIFEKSIRWVIEHRDSELWLNAPWFGMQIFNKSYEDRPSVWAKHLVEIITEWEGSENMLVRMCFALGHLREPLGGKVPITLKNIARKQTDEKSKGIIFRQADLFNGENFNKGHHRTPIIRVKECKEELINGQNKEVAKMAAIKPCPL